MLIRSQLSTAATGIVESYEWDTDPHLNLWAKVEAARNRAMHGLRIALKTRLRYEGHQLEVIRAESNTEVKTLLKQARDDIKMEHCIAVAEARNLTPAEAKALDQQETLEPSEQLALKKYQLAEFYCHPIEDIDSDFVAFDNEGRTRGHLKNLEAFLHPEDAIDSDLRSLKRQAHQNRGLSPWDLDQLSLKSRVRESLGLREYIEDLEREWSQGDLEEFAETATRYSRQIKSSLRFTIRDSMSPTQILNQLLEQLGIKTRCRRHRTDDGILRIHAIDQARLNKLLAIVERRKTRRDNRTESDPSPKISNYGSWGRITPEPSLIERFRAVRLVGDLEAIAAMSTFEERQVVWEKLCCSDRDAAIRIEQLAAA